ncbi:MAG: hypothetical protein ACI9WU_001699 [Myxococcota bacterium]
MADSREARIEANFRAQYQTLDEATLREIAAGDVLWVRDGVYLHGARRAARAVLIERGCEDVPRIPLWDAEAARLPVLARMAAITVALLVCVAAVAGWTAAFPMDAPTDEQLCTAASQMIGGTDIAYHHKIVLTGCLLNKSKDGGEIRAIAFRGCLTLTEPQLARLQAQPDPMLMSWIARFGGRPAPGRTCAGPVVVAEGVVKPGQPWFVRLTPPGGP